MRRVLLLTYTKARYLRPSCETTRTRTALELGKSYCTFSRAVEGMGGYLKYRFVNAGRTPQ